MINYTTHLKHMMNAASHIEKPSGYLYKKIVAFVKTVKKRKFKYRAAWGKVYSFNYAAKNAKTLPYYDRYPMVLIIRRDGKKGYFDGINLHYVNPYYREILLRGISHLHISGSDRYLVNEFRETVSKFVQRIFRPCYHRYRMDHVRNMRYLPIPGILPVHFGAVKDQTFIKSGLQRVWMDSLKAITRGFRNKQKRDNLKKAKMTAERHARMHAKGERSSAKVKPKHGNASRMSSTAKNSRAATKGTTKKSITAKNSKASTGKRYKGKRK